MFAHKLALATGRADVGNMLDEIEPSEFTDWKAFHDVEPIDQRRLRDQLARGFAALFSAAIGSTVKDSMFSFDLPRFSKPVRQTAAQQIAIARTIADMANAEHGSRRVTHG